MKLILCALGVLCVVLAAGAQEPAAPQTVSPAQLQAALDKLGDLDYAMRTTATRTGRRPESAQALPPLLPSVSCTPDGSLRHRALYHTHR